MNTNLFMNVKTKNLFLVHIWVLAILLMADLSAVRAEALVNVASQANGGSVTASSSHGSGNFPVQAINNGDRKGVNWGNGGGWNDGTAGQYPDWVQINFAGTQSIGEIDVFTLQDNYTSPVEPTSTQTFSQYGISAFDVQYWDGSHWVNIGSVTNNNRVWSQFTFTPVTTDRIRILVNNSRQTYSRIVEVEAYQSAVIITPPNSPPQVDLTAPANNSTYVAPALISIDASASDSDGSISKVEFYSGTNLLNTDSVAPYSFNWTNVAAGNYSLTAKAFDNAGASTESTPVSVTVNAAIGSGGGTPVNVAAESNGGVATASSSHASGNFPPQAINNGDRKGLNWGNGGGWNDATGNQYPDWVQINFSATKTINEIDVFTLQDNYANPVEPSSTQTFSQYGITAFNVQYWDGTNWLNLGSVTNNHLVWSQFTFTPVTTDRIRVLVNSSLGFGYSRIVEVEAYQLSGTLPAPNIPPNVTLSAPGNNATFTEPASITINAGASDSDGSISKVEFYADSTLLNTDSVAPFSFNWTNMPAGNYSLTAKAYDNSGASTLSTAIPVSVNVVSSSIGSDVVLLNVAAQRNGGLASASSTYNENFSAQSIIDGDRKGLNWGNGGGWNDATDGQYPDWVQIDFAGPKTIGEIDVFTLQDNFANAVEPTPTLTFSQYGILAFDIQYWDGSSWVTVSNVTNHQQRVWSQVTFPRITTNSIRVRINYAQQSFSRIVEVEAYYNATANSPPSVSLLLPDDDVSYPAPATIPISAVASDSDGSISKVELYWGTTLLDTVTSEPYSFNWSNVPAGTYTLTAKAYDNESSSTTSEAVTVTVNPPSGSGVMGVNRPTVTKNGAAIQINWDNVVGASSYVIYSTHDIATSGSFQTFGSTSNAISIPTSTFNSLSSLYFSVAPIIDGIEQQKSQWAYLAQFSDNDLGFWGAIAISDLNNDGCIEVLGTVNDCRGNLNLRPESSIGLSALRASGRYYRDVRVFDFNGDFINDLVSNVYSNDSRSLLYFGNGDGTFSPATQSQFPTIYSGAGETVVTADFDNDGDLDIFMPNYPNSAQAQNQLFQNQGNGNFIEIADIAGIADRVGSGSMNPEGAQALDFNQDGFVDIYEAGHLYMNNGNMSFTDQRSYYLLPPLHDEGLKFFDWNNDGVVDLLLHDPASGEALFQFNGHYFVKINNVFQDRYYNESYGINAEDVDGDGFQDVIVAGGSSPSGSYQNPSLFLYRQNSYRLIDLPIAATGWSDIAGFADFDKNGTLDIILRAGNLHYLKNTASDSTSIKVSMLGAAGEKNQQGRIVHASSPNQAGLIMTRIVDGGSGYLSNNEYQLTFPTPNGKLYWISAQYDNGIVGGWAPAGSDVKIYRDGRFIVSPR